MITAILAGAAAIGAGICAYNHASASSDCQQAFAMCTNGGTYEFESGACGGDCSIMCNPPT